jgi:hypothetical protein
MHSLIKQACSWQLTEDFHTATLPDTVKLGMHLLSSSFSGFLLEFQKSFFCLSLRLFFGFPSGLF